MISTLRNTLPFLVVAILSAVVVTLLVLLLSPDYLGQWLRALAATSISALFAVAVGVGLFYRQTNTTAEHRKQQLVQLLEAEVGDIKNVLDDTDLIVAKLPY